MIDTVDQIDLSHLSVEDKIKLLDLLREKEIRQKRNLIATYFTDDNRHLYPKHTKFFCEGKTNKMRLFMAANRVGKTLTAAYELTCHLTGIYPDWWEGKKFDSPNHWWVAGKDSRTTMSILQNTLLGPVGDFGTGMIPHKYIDWESTKDAKKADTGISVFRVKHISGRYSSVEFKTYDSGRKSFEGTERSIWLDEEPPLSVFTECLLRTATGNNVLMMTFTPLQGISETILNFLEGSQFVEGHVGVGKSVVMATWDDVPHLSEQDKKILLASIPPYQRDARTKGIPQLGRGAIYPIPESEILVDRFTIPDDWKRLYGLDVGWNNTAAVWIAQEPSTNIWYLYSTYKKGESEPSIHAQAIKSRGDWIMGAIDSAARGRSQTDGENLMQMYQDLGLKLQNADKAVETGLYTVWELLSTGQLKVFRDLHDFLEEYRLYRRDEKGKVVKSLDHIMDAMRYAIMGRELARTKPLPTRQIMNRNMPSRDGWV
jgi:phage terminase large subunit-like protein